MSNGNNSGEAVAKLAQEYEDDDSLIKEIAMRAIATSTDPSVAGTYNPEVTYDFEDAGLIDDLLQIGERIFNRVQGQLHAVVCGKEMEDEDDRNKILGQIGLDDAAIGGAIVAVLVSTLAVNPAVAIVVAALIVRRVIKPAARAGRETICEIWKVT
jgi:hypothetical protein